MAPALLLLAARDVVFSLQITFVPAAGHLRRRSARRTPRPTFRFFIYRNGFEYLRYGYAAAATVVLFAVTLATIAIQYRVARRWT